MIISADTVVKVKCTDGNNIGFAWTPHGTYARDLEHFVKLLDFTPMESIVAATAGVAKLFMREDELGKVLPGYLADLILVNGDPLEEISVLQVSPALRVRAKSHGKPMSRYSMSNIGESLLNRTCTRTRALSRGSSGRSPVTTRCGLIYGLQ